MYNILVCFFFFSSRRRHTRFDCDWSSDVCSSDLSRWGLGEWDFLLRDLQRRLAPGGKIYLTLNPLPNGDYLTPELRDFFSSRGADIERERIFFPNGVHK